MKKKTIIEKRLFKKLSRLATSLPSQLEINSNVRNLKKKL